MKFHVKTLLVALVALLLAVPTGAMAKGKPSWAGQGNGGHGKPSWAGQGHGKADKAKGKAAHEKAKGNKHQAEAEGDENDPDELSLEDLQALEDISAPGQYCHALESMQDSLAGMFGGESFDEHFGTNHNLANSFGKCASWRAQGGELSEEEAEEEAAEDSCEPSEEEGAEEVASEEEGTSEEPTGEEPAEGEEGTEDECESEEPADEDGEGSEGDEAEDEEFSFEELEGLNPAQYCFALAAELSDFAGMFGTNWNDANAHGKCVSRRAHGEDLAEAVEDTEGEEAAEEDPADSESGDEAEGDQSEDEESEDEESEDEPFTMTVTIEVDLSFLRA
jgi:hypothetical protein